MDYNGFDEGKTTYENETVNRGVTGASKPATKDYVVHLPSRTYTLQALHPESFWDLSSTLIDHQQGCSTRGRKNKGVNGKEWHEP
ncbi:hypothetical protein YC2023_051085 [Brassica napus]